MINIFQFLIAAGVLCFGSAAVSYLIMIYSDLRELRIKSGDVQIKPIDASKEVKKTHLVIWAGIVVFFLLVLFTGGFRA